MSDPALAKAKFVYGNVLVGLSIIKDFADLRNQHEKSDDDTGHNGDLSVYEFVKRASRALAPVIMPMIDYLGALTDEDVSSLGEIGVQE